MKKRIGLLVMIALGMVVLIYPAASFAITLYADLTADTNYNAGSDSNGLDLLATVSTQPEIALSTSDEVYFSFASTGTEFANNDALTFVFPTGWTTGACGTATTDSDSDGSADGAFSFGTASATYAFTAATTIASTTGVEFCIDVTTDGSAGNDAITLSSSSTISQTGAAFIYNGDDNDIAVTAVVQNSLFFALRNTVDSADTNACDLGTLDSASVGTCSYRIAAETAAQNGYTVYVRDTSATAGLTANAGADDIDAITEDSTVTAGSEGYGMALTAPATTTEQGDFTDDDTPFPTSTTAIYAATTTFDYVQGVTSTSALVTHNAAIDADTAAGSYTQTVSYYITGNF